MYVYIRSEPQLWTVGHYSPDGKFDPESDHGTPDDAAKRVRYLNGGNDQPESTLYSCRKCGEDYERAYDALTCTCYTKG